MPQITIENTSMTQLVARAGAHIERIPKLKKEIEHKNIVGALHDIAIGVDYEDGSEEPSIMGAAYSKTFEIAKVLDDHKSEINTMSDVLTSVKKVLTGIFEIDDDGTRRLCNALGSESGGEVTNQTIETKISTSEEGRTLLQISFMEKYNKQSGNVSISIPLSSNLEVIDSKQAKIVKQSGTLANDSFTEVGEKIVNAANQAAIKFQIYARETDTVLARNGLFKNQ